MPRGNENEKRIKQTTAAGLLLARCVEKKNSRELAEERLKRQNIKAASKDSESETKTSKKYPLGCERILFKKKYEESLSDRLKKEVEKL